MKWKDTGGAEDANLEKSDPYYAEDGYASFKDKGHKKTAMLSANPVRYLYWGLGVAVLFGVVLLVILPFTQVNESSDMARIRALEQKIGQLEQRLEKYDGVDEKVTRIWEQAKAFETFKARFDRSEASMSLRMDHLAMSLDALQKKTDQTMKRIDNLSRAPAPPPVSAGGSTVKKRSGKTHTVGAGDTLFSISQRYGLTVQELRSLNQLTDESVIQVGQTLKVSPSGG